MRARGVRVKHPLVVVALVAAGSWAAALSHRGAVRARERIELWDAATGSTRPSPTDDSGPTDDRGRGRRRDSKT